MVCISTGNCRTFGIPYAAAPAAEGSIHSFKRQFDRASACHAEAPAGADGKQDYEIHLATLQERNRIAREIHDNVGHMLSRAILQMGALQTIHREEPLHGQLMQINDTLGEAMNSIRESVHDLHNESLDLKQALFDICKEFEKIMPLTFIMI